MADYYRVLEVNPEASQREIRAAFRRLALRWHPDRSQDPSATERFRALTEAYEVLRVPERRRAYDETHWLRPAVDTSRPKSAKAGRAALSWVEEFFIQAGGIEAEGPAKGSLRRFGAEDLEAIWAAIAARLLQCGELRQSIRQLELVLHYARRHPEIGFPAGAEDRIEQKLAILRDLEALYRRTDLPWEQVRCSLVDLLRRQRYAEARSLLIWRAAHAGAEELAQDKLFEPSVPVQPPLRELAMVDRLAQIAAGDKPRSRVGHGYVECRNCRGWAMTWGVGVPRCASCGSYRLGLRHRDERDDWLQALIRRDIPRFAIQENARRRAAVQGLERWVWLPLFLFAFGLTLVPGASAGLTALGWPAVCLFAAGWFAGAWSERDVRLADTDVLYPDEADVARAAARTVRRAAALALALLAVAYASNRQWYGFAAAALGAALVARGRAIRRSIGGH